MKKDKHCFWGTKSEKMFLIGLGSYRSGRPSAIEEHRSQLKKYFQIMPSRARWGEIKREEIEKFVIQRIALWVHLINIVKISSALIPWKSGW